MYIVFPIIPWGFYKQRPQQLAERLGALGEYVFYLSPVAEDRAASFGVEHGFNFQQQGRGVFHFWVKTSSELDIHSAKQDFAVLGQISSVILRLFKDTKPILWVQHPAWLPLVKEIVSKLDCIVLYDCMDHYASFSGSDPSISRLENELVNISDKIIVTGTSLEKHINSIGGKAIIVSNGVDFSLFRSRAFKSKDTEAAENKKRVGYVGSIRDWFDVETLEFIATNLPQVTFDIIGTVEDNIQLPHKNNVRILGRRSEEEIPAILNEFDACLIPFKRTPLTEATDPVKMYEYFSLGKAVVATRLEELEKFGDLVYLASNKEEFLLHLENILSGKEEVSKYEKRISLAERNDWQIKAKEFLEVTKGLDFTKISELQCSLMASLYENLASMRQDFEAELIKRDEEWRLEIQKRDKEWRIEIQNRTGRPA